MNTDTPTVDALGVEAKDFILNRPYTKVIGIEHARTLERSLRTTQAELNAARAEIERLDTAGIHSCHKDCQRPNCVLRRERDELATCLASEKITRNYMVELASETERELTAITEQRDEEWEIYQKLYSAELARANHYKKQHTKMVEALERILEYQGRFAEEDPQSIAREALQSLTTNAQAMASADENTPPKESTL